MFIFFKCYFSQITNLPDSETISKNKKSQKINLLKILVPKLNRTDKLTFRNLVDQKTRLEVVLIFIIIYIIKLTYLFNLTHFCVNRECDIILN